MGSFSCDKLVPLLHQQAPLGLANGKMGFCLFAFWLSRQENSKSHHRIAESLLNEVVNSLSRIREIDITVVLPICQTKISCKFR